VQRSRRLDSLLNVVRLLAGPELDDPKVCEPVPMEGVFGHDRFDLLPRLGHRQNDPAFSRYLPTRDEELAGSVVFLQKTNVRTHVCIDLFETGFVDELDYKHG